MNAPLPLPKDFEEAVVQFGGDRRRASLQLLQFEASQMLGRHVAHNRRTDELVVVADRLIGNDEDVQIIPPARIPDAREIEMLIEQTVQKYEIPIADRPKITGFRLIPTSPR